MNTSRWISVLALAASLLAPARAADSTVPFRSLSFDAAALAAAAEGKLVFIDFFTTWCEPCKRLDAETWSDPAVAKLLGEKTVPLRLDAEKEEALATRFKVEAYPTMLLLKPDGTEVDRLIGFRDAPKFIEEFTEALAGQNSLARAQAAVAAASTSGSGDAVLSPEAVQSRYDLGRLLAASGKAEAALKEYLWCYDEGMVRVPSYAGVRNSFLLGSIAQLGRSYPPALAALRERRDQAEKQMMAGPDNRSAAMDFASLNGELDENQRTLIAFDKLPPDDSRRGGLLLRVYDLLIEARRYGDAAKARSFAKMTAEFDRNIQYLSIVANKPSSEMIKKAQTRYIVSTATKNIEVLAGAGDLEHARDLAAKLLSFDGSDETKALLKQHVERAGHPELAAQPAVK
jgi:thiol-disulfide isomerase/thioredoxin